jgi:hypothetical protein
MDSIDYLAVEIEEIHKHLIRGLPLLGICIQFKYYHSKHNLGYIFDYFSSSGWSIIQIDNKTISIFCN